MTGTSEARSAMGMWVTLLALSVYAIGTISRPSN